MTVVLVASGNPVSAIARELYEQSGRAAILFDTEQELDQMIARNPELLDATALFPVPAIPNQHYVCSGRRLERLGQEALIPDWSKRFSGQLALLDMPLDKINERLPGLQTAMRTGLKLPTPPHERTDEEKRRRAEKRAQRRIGQSARRNRAAMGHFAR